MEQQLALRRLFVSHADRLAVILSEIGWPDPVRHGEAAASAAFVIAQHADTQLDVQRMALGLRAAVDMGVASARDLALLEDRAAVNEGREQAYGTQIARVVDGWPVPWPCSDQEQMDERRVAVGLLPFDEHVRQFLPPC